jgi:Ca2+-binding RTX toxin-like protein
MNICQISSHDLLLCLNQDDLAQSSFFQQVLAIAEEDHLVCISDYAIQAFLQTELPPAAQLQFDRLLDQIDIWQIDDHTYTTAKDLSHDSAISFADAIDQLIADSLCPDWILVIDSGRSLPNATSIEEFWQEWQSLRDDLPPSGGLAVGRPPSGGNGGGSPTADSNKSSRSQQLQSETNLLASNSVVFSHRNFISWSMGLYYTTNAKAGPTSSSSQASSDSDSTVDWLASNPALQAEIRRLNVPNPLPNNIRVIVDPDQQKPTIVIITTPNNSDLPIQLTASATAGNLAAVQFAADRFTGQSGGAIESEAKSSDQSPTKPQNQVLQGTANSDRLIASAGNDILEGRGGADFLDGSAGVDTASYQNSDNGVTVNLETGLGSTGEAQGDRLQNIENLEGSNFNDTLVGDRQDNVLLGKAGNNTLVGGLGNDILQVSLGNNVLVGDSLVGDGLQFFDSNQGLIVTAPSDQTVEQPIAPLPPSIVFVGGDVTITTEPSPTPMLPAPPSLPNMNGSDWIFAAAGDDVIDAGDGNNFIDAGSGNNRVSSGNGQDLFVLSLGSGVTTILNYQHHDRFGLVGGVAYEDLRITAISEELGYHGQTQLPSAPSPKVKISVKREGGEDILAIVVGVTPEALKREVFLTIQYQDQTLPNISNPIDSSPAGMPSPAGMTQAIPDWLSVSRQSGNVLQVPAISQLAPNLVLMDRTGLDRAA